VYRWATNVYIGAKFTWLSYLRRNQNLKRDIAIIIKAGLLLHFQSNIIPANYIGKRIGINMYHYTITKHIIIKYILYTYINLLILLNIIYFQNNNNMHVCQYVFIIGTLCLPFTVLLSRYRPFCNHIRYLQWRIPIGFLKGHATPKNRHPFTDQSVF
jgi:hypothetical protein